MTLAEVMNRNYSFVAAADLDDGGWVIKYPDLPGCMTTADTYDEIATEARAALEAWATSRINHGEPIPEPGNYPLPEWDWSDDGAEGEVMTTEQVAQHLGVTPRRVRAIAVQRRLGKKLGRSLVFHRSELAKLRPGRRGRPRGNV